MKIKFQVLIAFCLVSLNMNAQQWYPGNANWIFNKQELLSFPAHGYIKYSVIKDTIISDTTAKLITIDTLHYNGEKSVKDSLFMYESNSRIYFWNGNQFKLMYDFNLNVGDTLSVDIDILNCDSVSPIIVDSISNMNLNGQDLKVQHISYTLYAEGQYGFNSTISEQLVERIGSEKHFIFSPSCIIEDEFTYSGLRCYNDNTISYKNEWWKNHFPEIACDSLLNATTTNIKETIKGEFLISPNPTNDFVTISNRNVFADDFYIELYNLSGEQLDRIFCKNTATIDLNKYQSGVYIIKIYQNSTTVYTFKIIKN
ncbi:MAG: hypothetical protein CSB06_00735 [Bacteroidia bacterium]|nr:MAG: hypothetical protein CSB06_00735 [Bacteroidia bacterium]